MVIPMAPEPSRDPPSTASTVDIIDRLWVDSGGEHFGFTYGQLETLLLQVAVSSKWGVGDAATVSVAQQGAFLRSIRVADLVLARACAKGDERAWEAFLIQYREMLYGAAYAITRDDAIGRELADSLYAELFGMRTRDGQRRSKLEFYTGRGSLAGWLRSVLARRYIDDYRKTRPLISIEEQEMELPAAMLETSPLPEADRNRLAVAIEGVLRAMSADDCFLLHAYYLDGRTLAEIARLLGVHESTISRRVKRLASELRKRLLKRLQADGFSRSEAEEALSSDVRDIDVNVRSLLQVAEEKPFPFIEASEVGTNWTSEMKAAAREES